MQKEAFKSLNLSEYLLAKDKQKLKFTKNTKNPKNMDLSAIQDDPNYIVKNFLLFYDFIDELINLKGDVEKDLFEEFVIHHDKALAKQA